MKNFKEKEVKDLKKVNGGASDKPKRTKKTHYKENIGDGVAGNFWSDTDLGFSFWA